MGSHTDKLTYERQIVYAAGSSFDAAGFLAVYRVQRSNGTDFYQWHAATLELRTVDGFGTYYQDGYTAGSQCGTAESAIAEGEAFRARRNAQAAEAAARVARVHAWVEQPAEVRDLCGYGCGRKASGGGLGGVCTPCAEQ